MASRVAEDRLSYTLQDLQTVMFAKAVPDLPVSWEHQRTSILEAVNDETTIGHAAEQQPVYAESQMIVSSLSQSRALDSKYPRGDTMKTDMLVSSWSPISDVCEVCREAVVMSQGQ
jgi:hypothetical protein